MRYRGFYHSLDTIRRRFHGAITGNLYYIIAKTKGVKFGSRPFIVGKPKFRIYPGSKLIVGRQAEILSGATANLIGINRPCIFSTHNEASVLEIGDMCGFSGTVVGAHKRIVIGNNVKCGANTLITDSDWHPEDPRSGDPREVVIGDNVWLGVNSVVLKGVRIGENTIIGANAVVSRDIPANVIAAGNPCKVIRSI